MKTVLWEYQAVHSVEYCHLSATNDAFILTGAVVLLLDQLPAHVTYKVECDSQWKTQTVVIQQEWAGATKYLTLEVNDQQIWRSEGAIVPFATGFYDIDLAITPATNTLPIRRLGLGLGESRQVDAVWVRFPGLTIEPLRQRYTRIDPQRYRYEGLSTGYETQLDVDELDLVVDYQGAWRRVPAIS